MIRRLIVLVFLMQSLLGMSVYGQSDFLTPKKVKNAFQTELLLKEYVDLQYLESHLPDFQHIETVKVDGTVDIAKAAFLCSKLSMIQELHLYKFEGIIADEDLQYLEWVPYVSIYIPKNRIDATVLNDAWRLLSQVSLRFEEVPDNFDFLKGWKQLRNLSVLGNINKEEADALLKIVQSDMPRLKHIELSLIGVQELPPRIKECKQLHSIRIIDGSEWAQGISTEEMGEFVMPLRTGSRGVKIGKGVNSATVEKNVYMPLKWVSTRPRLSTKEVAYLKNLFPDVIEHEALTWLEDTEWELDFAVQESLSAYPFAPASNEKAFWGEFAEGKHSFLAHSESDQVFLGDRQWSVSIPKNALMFADGKPYFGPYHVSIQYIDEAAEAAASGLSLHYDSNRAYYALHPSFCLDVRVLSSDRKHELQLKPGYFSEVNYAVGVHESDRFYAWHANQRKWMHFYDYDYQFDAPGLPAKVDFYQFYKGAETAKIRSDFQSWTLEEAFQTEGFNYLMPPQQFEMRLGKYKGHFVLDPPGNAKEIRRIIRGKNQLGIRALPRNKKSASGIQELVIFDRTHSLFPELEAFEGYRLAFQTQMPYDKVLAFFKEKNWVDVRFKELGKTCYLELKTHRGIWVIPLMNPGTFVVGDAKVKSKADANFKKRFAKYEKMRTQKAVLWHFLRQQTEVAEREAQKAALFGVASSNARKKGRFMIQSFGLFSMAHPVEVPTAQSELILCELGKIPLKLKRVALVFEGDPYTVIMPEILSTLQIPVTMETLQFIMAETPSGEVYYIEGGALRNLQIAENTLTYVELKPLKNSPKNTSELLKEMGVRATKKRKKS